MESTEVKELEISEINNEKHFVAFLDILGFKSHIDNYFNGNDPSILNKIRYALKISKQYTLTPHKNFLEESNSKIKFKQFSDCICISMPYSKKENTIFGKFILFINMLRSYQSFLFGQDIYVRGGLSSGFHFEDNNIIFSKGLVDSYLIESKKAIYPRIVIDENLIKELKPILTEQIGLMRKCNLCSAFLLDEAGLLFLNPFKLGSYAEKAYNYDKNMFNKANRFVSDPNWMNSFEEEDKGKKLKELDEKIIEDVFKNVERQIKYYKGELVKNNYSVNQYEKLRKYLWLKELIKWNKDKDSSKIKFEYFLK